MPILAIAGTRLFVDAAGDGGGEKQGRWLMYGESRLVE